MGTNLPSPLYGLYAARFGFSALTVTLIVAVYAAVIVPSLLLAGPLADVAGYRRVVIPALVLAMAGALLFASAAGTGWLFAARIVQGLAVGAATRDPGVDRGAGRRDTTRSPQPACWPSPRFG